jgi:hypothetical protein
VRLKTTHIVTNAGFMQQHISLIFNDYLLHPNRLLLKKQITLLNNEQCKKIAAMSETIYFAATVFKGKTQTHQALTGIQCLNKSKSHATI